MKRTFMASIHLLAIAAVGLILALADCDPVSLLEEEYDIAVLAYVLDFSVPDSSSQNNIPVTLRGTIGESTAYSFDRINFARTDSVFRIGVWGREKYKTGVLYEPRSSDFDTILVLTTPRKGLHYVDVIAAQGILRDSTFVY